MNNIVQRDRQSVRSRIREAETFRDVLESDPTYSSGKVLFDPFLDHFRGILPDEWLFLFEKIMFNISNEDVPVLGAEEVDLDLKSMKGQANKADVTDMEQSERQAIEEKMINIAIANTKTIYCYARAKDNEGNKKDDQLKLYRVEIVNYDQTPYRYSMVKVRVIMAKIKMILRRLVQRLFFETSKEIIDKSEQGKLDGTTNTFESLLGVFDGSPLMALKMKKDKFNKDDQKKLDLLAPLFGYIDRSDTYARSAQSTVLNPFLFENILYENKEYKITKKWMQNGRAWVRLEHNNSPSVELQVSELRKDEYEKNYAIRALNMNHYDILKQTFFSVLLYSLRVGSLFEVNPVKKIVKDINSGDYFLYVGKPNKNIVTFEDLHRLKSDAETVKLITGAMKTLSFLQSVLDFQHGEFMISSVFWNKQKKEVVINPSRYTKLSFLEDGIEPKSYDAALFFTSIAKFYIGLLREEEDDTDAEGSDDVEALDGGGGVNVGGAIARTCLYIYEEYKKKFIEEASYFENDNLEDDLTKKLLILKTIF